MCLSNEKTMTNITAVDLDLPPYSAPFHYELLEDDQMQGKWKIEPNHGTTVNLVRESTVYAGHYEIKIKISDNQGYGSVQRLSITVCDCSSKPNCHVRSFMSRPSVSSSVIMIFAFLLLLVILLMALPLCKKQKKTMILSDDTPGNLIMYNTELPGTDCKVPFETAHLIQSSVKMANGIFKQHSMLHNVTQSASASTSHWCCHNRLLSYNPDHPCLATLSPKEPYAEDRIVPATLHQLPSMSSQSSL
ncbi:hypothetical protein PDJAM_G00069950 [Pangasius djambal]|uniref:Uncharacterized protein n=1 Tax=Pangasius djambal TaxID=1691987 RepID=A0ACC5Z0S2_9TELE|nr:hypothetical protein [Pangasius djambal]